jgi:hypothetical protein
MNVEAFVRSPSGHLHVHVHVSYLGKLLQAFGVIAEMEILTSDMAHLS